MKNKKKKGSFKSLCAIIKLLAKSVKNQKLARDKKNECRRIKRKP